MKDYTEHKKLYLLCFTEDTKEDAELLFKNVFSKAKMLSEYNEAGLPIAMLFLMDAKIISLSQAEDYYYLYAACTHPNYRGKGIMGRLLEKAKQEAINDKKQGIFLKPANPPLFNFYAKSDFLPYFKVCKISMGSAEFVKQYPPKELEVSTTNLKDWYSLRQEFLTLLNSQYVEFSENMLSAAADGCTVIKAEDFGFVYEIRDDLLLVKEAICKKGSVNNLFAGVSNVLATTNCSKTEIRLPPALKDELLDFDNILQPFSVMWFTAKGKSLETNGHHGFAFD